MGLLCAAIACSILTSQKELRLLFFGNSHTGNFNVPGMVKSLLESDGTGRRVYVDKMVGGVLNDWSEKPESDRKIKEGRFDFVILQGAMLSSSHKYKYSQDGAIRLAKLAKSSGSHPLLFAEWSRKNWQESGYIMGIYKEIAKASGAEIVPVCYAFDKFLKISPKAELWQGDGNHSTLAGAYMAACAFYYRISGKQGANPTWVPQGLNNAGLVANLRRCAREAATK